MSQLFISQRRSESGLHLRLYDWAGGWAGDDGLTRNEDVLRNRNLRWHLADSRDLARKNKRTRNNPRSGSEHRIGQKRRICRKTRSGREKRNGREKRSGCQNLVWNEDRIGREQLILNDHDRTGFYWQRIPDECTARR